MYRTDLFVGQLSVVHPFYSVWYIAKINQPGVPNIDNINSIHSINNVT